MTNDQKQKVMQLLELCIDTPSEQAECMFSFQPQVENVWVRVAFGGFKGSFDETYDAYVNQTNGEIRLDAIIEAVSSIPSRATECIAAKVAARREKLIKEYEEVFGKKN